MLLQDSAGRDRKEWVSLRRILEVRSEGLKDLNDGLNMEGGMVREKDLPKMAVRFLAWASCVSQSMCLVPLAQLRVRRYCVCILR